MISGVPLEMIEVIQESESIADEILDSADGLIEQIQCEIEQQIDEHLQQAEGIVCQCVDAIAAPIVQIGDSIIALTQSIQQSIENRISLIESEINVLLNILRLSPEQVRFPDVPQFQQEVAIPVAPIPEAQFPVNKQPEIVPLLQPSVSETIQVEKDSDFPDGIDRVESWLFFDSGNEWKQRAYNYMRELTPELYEIQSAKEYIAFVDSLINSIGSK